MEQTTKLFEVRDRSTTCPVLCIDTQRLMLNTLEIPRYTVEGEREYLIMRRAGFSENRCILYHPLNKDKMVYDPYLWGDRTFFTSHQYIIKNWDSLESGAIVDVEFILGETEHPKETDL